MMLVRRSSELIGVHIFDAATRKYIEAEARALSLSSDIELRLRQWVNRHQLTQVRRCLVAPEATPAIRTKYEKRCVRSRFPH